MKNSLRELPPSIAENEYKPWECILNTSAYSGGKSQSLLPPRSHILSDQQSEICAKDEWGGRLHKVSLIRRVGAMWNRSTRTGMNPNWEHIQWTKG